MPYYPSSVTGIYIISEGNSEGNLTLSSDGYWNAIGVYIDTINVATASNNWSLYLCENNTFSTSHITSKLLVAHGLGDYLISVGSVYNSGDTNVYLKWNDLTGSATASFYISGRTLGL